MVQLATQRKKASRACSPLGGGTSGDVAVAGRDIARKRTVRLAVCARKEYTVTLQLPGGKERTIQAGSDGASIWDIASDCGLPLPASCKVGSCSACCAKLVSGKVSTKGQTCVPPGLQKLGYIALCCARPQCDCVIVTHQGPALRAARRALEEAKFASA